ncbi:insulin receptor substrate 1 isoform X2 [Anabrus simplex]|uniref:insulin receptor substrate 1 isoform X2 n=1 Tax=Anabrus simplex TaxID=316456 RepID=UPI0035A33F7E
MSSVQSTSSGGDSTWKDLDRHDGRAGVILKMGYLKKLKTMRKKFFVLRGESSESSAQLEYYDSEKKWKSHNPPKRAIALKTCFNINRRLDLKHKFAIALYTKDDCFCVVLDSEDELEEWLTALLSLQHGEDVPDGEPPKPIFEHVWQVQVQKKGLGNSRNILGPFLLCLTDKTLSLVKMSQEERPDTYEFSLMSIRRCGHSDCFFYMEVGRSSCTGAGDLWMQTEDTNIAQNMHDSILSAMSNNSLKEELGPRPRTRSSSANEASKPITMLHRRQTHIGSTKTPNYYSTSEEMPRTNSHPTNVQAGMTYCEQYPITSTTASTPDTTHNQGSTTGRERCDSMPSRARTTSEGHHQALPHATRNIHLVPGHGASRPHSMYSRGISYSPPVASSPVSPASAACSTDSASSSLSIDDGENYSYGHSLTPDEPVIMEENCDEYERWSGVGTLDYLAMDHSMPSLSLPVQSVVPSATAVSNAPHRKISPGLGTNAKVESPSQSSYMEMYSPCGSSPLDSTGGYMAMSPGVVGSAPSEATPRMHMMYTRSSNSINHSRGSSLTEDGYVPMAPALTDDGYVDMDPLQPSNIIHEHFQHGEMSPASSCSITSGTPSTDLRFSEYHLEKVSSYFTPSEEDETSSLDRPIRAYSVGSRPENLKKSNRLEVTNQAADASRVRAFSVGSRTAPGIKLSSRPLAHASRYQPSTTLTPPTQHHLSGPPGKKSSSAPLLSTSWSGSSSLRQAAQAGTSHSSGEPMDDLMEMDFTRNNRPLPPAGKLVSHHDRQVLPSSVPTSSGMTAGYVEMAPQSTMVSSPKPQTPSSPYVDMKSGLSDETTNIASSPPYQITRPLTKANVTSGPYMDMRSTPTGELQSAVDSTKTLSVSPKTRLTVGPYIEMKSGGSISSSPPGKAVVKSFKEEAPYVHMKSGNNSEGSIGLPRPVSMPGGMGAYMDMRGADLQNIHSPVVSTSPYVDMRTGSGSRKPTSPIQEEYMDMSIKPVRKITRQENEKDIAIGMGSSSIARTAPVDTPQPKMPPEGYVEMSWSRGSKPLLKSSLEDYNSVSGSGDGVGSSTGQEDYMNMSYEGRSSFGSRKKERRGSRKEKNRYSSQPIAIQTSSNANTSSTASTSPVFSFSNLITPSGRKSLTGTPPKIPPSFLPLGSTSVGGSSSSPGTSPFSSLRRNRSRKISNAGTENGSRRESCDMNSGLTTPTGSSATIFPFSLNSPSSPMKPFPGTALGNKLDSTKSSTDSIGSSSRILSSYPDVQQLSTSPTSPESSSSSEQPTPVNTEALDDITETHDYVNFSPQQVSAKDQRDNGDYTVMRPVPVISSGSSYDAARKISAPVFGVIDRKISSVNQGMVDLTLSTPSLSSTKTAAPVKESTPPFIRKSSLGQSFSSSSPLFRPIPKLSTASEVSNGPKIVTSSSALLNKQLSYTGSNSVSDSSKNQSLSVSKESVSSFTGSYKGRQLSRSSSGSSETGRNQSISSLDSNRSQEETLSVKSDSGTISPSLSSRPPSVSSEREVHYASLDLAPSGSEGEEVARSPRSLKTESSASSPSPNPTSHQQQGEAFSYAEIDFAKSEGLRNVSPLNRKSKH